MTEQFGHSTTGEDICSFNGLGTNAAGKCVAITGGNSGLGFETAKLLAKYGAEVTIFCRSEGNGVESVNKIKAEFENAIVSYALVDLASFQSIRDAAIAYLQTGKPLHILVNNAGVMACPLAYTKDDQEMQFGVNHLGHFLLTGLLLPALERSGTPESPSRVVTLSSIGHHIYTPYSGIMFEDLQAKQSYDIWTRYGNAKFANVLFAKELQNRCTSKGLPIVSVALHPGVITETALLRHQSLMAALLTSVAVLWTRPHKLLALMEANKNTSQGIATTVACCVYPTLIPGGYYVDCQCKPTNVMHCEASNPDMARRLWEVSEEITGSKFL